MLEAVTFRTITYEEARLGYFKKQLAHSERVMNWWAKNSDDFDTISEKGAIVSYYEDVIKMLEKVEFQENGGKNDLLLSGNRIAIDHIRERRTL